MDTDKKISSRTFLLSFSVAFLGFALCFAGLMTVLHPKAPFDDTTEPVYEAASSYVPTREEGLSVLFVGVSPDGSSADTFVLAAFDPARGSVPIVTFPPETAVRNNGRMESLAEVFRYGGADYTRARLQETLGVPIQRFVRMDAAAFVVAANTIGTVEFQLPREIALNQGAEVILSPGLQLLDGERAAALIQHDAYEDGQLERCALISDLTAAIVNQRMDIVLSAVADNIFEKIINLIESDISYQDYDDRKQAAAFLARLGQEPAYALPVDGLYTDNGLYQLADTFTALLTQVFA